MKGAWMDALWVGGLSAALGYFTAQREWPVVAALVVAVAAALWALHLAVVKVRLRDRLLADIDSVGSRRTPEADR